MDGGVLLKEEGLPEAYPSGCDTSLTCGSFSFTGQAWGQGALRSETWSLGLAGHWLFVAVTHHHPSLVPSRGHHLPTLPRAGHLGWAFSQLLLQMRFCFYK